MIIQHFKYPFMHTVIYDFFNPLELTLLKEEAIGLLPQAEQPTGSLDTHHDRLRGESRTLSISVDIAFGFDRAQSKILERTRKLFELASFGVLANTENEFIEYIAESNNDVTHLQLYQNGSSYFSHKDGAVVTALYPLMFDKTFTGGRLVFDRFNYAPHLRDGCCLIFPSYQPHTLEPIVSDEEGVVRASINQRVYIK